MGVGASVNLGVAAKSSICVNLWNLWMDPLFCVLLRVLRMILSSRGVSVPFGGDRTWFYDPSELRTPFPLFPPGSPCYAVAPCDSTSASKRRTCSRARVPVSEVIRAETASR